MSRPWLFPLVAALVLVPFAGCRHSTIPLAKASGAVTLDGKPLVKGSVQFTPDNSKGTRGPMALGGIGPDGKFVLTTFKTGDGAQVGFHKVAVNCWEAAAFDSNDRRGPPPPRSLIPECYCDENASGLTAEVKAGIQNEFTFDLKSAAPGGAPQRR